MPLYAAGIVWSLLTMFGELGRKLKTSATTRLVLIVVALAVLGFVLVLSQ